MLILAIESVGGGAVSRVVEVLGLVGAFLVAVGYATQIVHLVHEKCSAGVSMRAWCLWLTASILISAHAFLVLDAVFIASQVVNITAIVTIIALARRHAGTACEDHRLLAVGRQLRVLERSRARAVLGPPRARSSRRTLLLGPVTAVDGRPLLRSLSWSQNGNGRIE